jgi:hypothetical protein
MKFNKLHRRLLLASVFCIEFGNFVLIALWRIESDRWLGGQRPILIPLRSIEVQKQHIVSIQITSILLLIIALAFHRRHVGYAIIHSVSICVIGCWLWYWCFRLQYIS